MKRNTFVHAFIACLSFLVCGAIVADDSNITRKARPTANCDNLTSCGEVVDCILARIDKKLPGCCTPTPIDCLPFVIKKSGKYCIAKDLVYKNSDAGHIGIDVQADSVDIDLCDHILSIKPGPLGSLIRINGHSDISIHDGTIKGSIPVDDTSATDWNGVLLEGTDSVLFDNVYFLDLRHGILFPAGFDNYSLTVNSCNFRNIFSRFFFDDFEDLNWFALSIGGFKIRGLLISDCNFTWDESGGPFPFWYGGIMAAGFEPDNSGVADNGIIRNCNFTNYCFPLAWWPEGNTHGSLIVENCNFLANPNPDVGFVAAIQLCCSLPDCVCRSLQVRHCNFQDKVPQSQEREGIAIPSGHSVIIEDCAFSLPYLITDTTVSEYLGASITVGNGDVGSVVDNCIIRGCTFQDEALRHIASYKTKGLLVENCQFTDACNQACLLSTGSALGFEDIQTQATIINNVFTNNPGSAVKVEDGITGSIVQDNKFRRNGVGLELGSGSDYTVATDNLFHLNDTQMLDNSGAENNTIMDNLETFTEMQEPCTPVFRNRKIDETRAPHPKMSKKELLDMWMSHQGKTK